MPTLRTIFVFAVMLFVTVGGLSRSTGAVAASQPLSGAPEECVQAFWGSGTQTGGKLINLRVNLVDVATEGDVYIALSSSDPAAVPLPAGVTVPAGEFSTTLQVVTNPVATTHAVVLTASTGKNCSDEHYVLIKAPQLKSLSVQSVMRGGGLGKVTVCLTGRAAAPVTVNMTSSDASLITPAEIVVPTGMGCVSYKSPVGKVVSITSVTLTAEDGGAALSGSTLVKPFPVAVPLDE